MPAQTPVPAVTSIRKFNMRTDLRWVAKQTHKSQIPHRPYAKMATFKLFFCSDSK